LAAEQNRPRESFGMEFLKKHYEKIVLAAALLVLIGSAVMLSVMVSAAGSALNEGPRRPPKGETIAHLSLDGYSNALVRLAEPVLWTQMPQDPFNTAAAEAPDIAVPLPPPGPEELPVQLLRVQREPFKLRFEAYSGEGRAFQLNLQFRPRTFFVEKVGDEVADRFERTGYIITRFERKTTNIVTRVGPRELDVSELTLQHPGEEPIVLVLGKEAVEREPVATIRCGASALTSQVRRGQRFDCEGNTYIVVDIKPTQMIIVDAQSEEKHIIDLAVARP
jgi:sorbitol-specific phosphotransferase system component IIA